tara:strand:+ start:4940 stop:5251 length:312 start_codon:yes stop_codon:yes gene_type:complete
MAKFTSETGREGGKKGGKISKRRPLDVQWRDKLTKALGDSDRSTLDAIYGILLNEAKGGNMQAIKELLDRSFGKAKQPIIGGDDTDEPIKTEINIIAHSAKDD